MTNKHVSDKQINRQDTGEHTGIWQTNNHGQDSGRQTGIRQAKKINIQKVGQVEKSKERL